MAARKTVSDRWWNLYLNDDGCKKNFNGLHLVCAMYGDAEEDSDTLMQSMAANRNYQLENFEFSSDSSDVSLFNDTISSCMWNVQYPEGYFAHLQSELPDIQVISGISQRTFVPVGRRGGRRLQTWEEWGWSIIRKDDEIKAGKMAVWISGKKLRNILTEQQKTELKNRLIHYHGEEKNGKIVVKDWHNPWMSREAKEYANYVRQGWQC
jgi:hypothetical protein